MKKFSEEVGKKIYSIDITVMPKNCFSPSFDDEGQSDDLIVLRNVSI